MRTFLENLNLSNMFLALTKARAMNDGVLSSITFSILSGYYGYWLLSTGVCIMAFGRNGSTRIPVGDCVWIVSL